ncbi:MAG: hypothetical protein U0361_21150 [Nitrospiraceae bacterium]
MPPGTSGIKTSGSDWCRELIDALGRVDRTVLISVLDKSASTHPFQARPELGIGIVRFPFFRRRFWEQVAPWLSGGFDLLHFPYDSCVVWKRGRFIHLRPRHQAAPLS